MMPFTPSEAERLRFDSDTVPEAERFEAYRRVYAGAEVRREPGPFRALLRAYRLDRALLYDRVLAGVSHVRGPAHVVATAFDHFTLTFVREGTVEIDDGAGLYRPVLAGELALLDIARPTRNRYLDAHIITLSLARERIAELGVDLSALHGLVLAAAQVGLLGDYLTALAQRLPTLAPAAIPAATKPLVPLLAIALAGAEPVAAPSDQAERVRRLIEAELADPRFGPAALVAKSGLSRATLYRLFQAQGGLALVIQRRRLERLRAALADPDDARPIGALALAAGFGSESHASRLFREAYGQRPGEYRAAAQPAGLTANPAARMQYWQDEVR